MTKSSKKQKPTAEDIVREFYEDVKSYYGMGPGDEIDTNMLDWSDLEVTYKKAVQFLKDHMN